jgi:hypothetical protein
MPIGALSLPRAYSATRYLTKYVPNKKRTPCWLPDNTAKSSRRWLLSALVEERIGIAPSKVIHSV